MRRQITPNPPEIALVADEVRQLPDNYGFRPKGGPDWLLIAVKSGGGHVSGRRVEMRDVILFPPGVPQDYGASQEAGFWENVWVHFVPRTRWLTWLDWPSLGGGVRGMRVPMEAWEEIVQQLREVVRQSLRPDRSRLGFAQNALEKALLLMDSSGSRADRDPRVHAMLAMISTRYREPLTILDLCDCAGLEKSQATALFRKSLGQPPMRYLQQERLRRGAELLLVTDRSIQQIAEDIGYASPFYFSNQFRAFYGRSPRTFRLRSDGGTDRPLDDR